MSGSGLLRRRVLWGLYGLGVVGVVGVFALLAGGSWERNDALSSIVSGLAALFTLFGSVVVYLRRTEPYLRVDEAAEAFAGALLAHWEPEMRERRRRFTDEPRGIPLSWGDASADFGTAPASVVGFGEDAGVVRLRLDGRLDENPDAAARQLAERFVRLPGKQRLVVLGEPGAGKTFLALTLTIGLLRGWVPGKAVAVFLSLASWDPIVESLDSWMVREIASLYFGGQRRVPTLLLDERRLIPVLDGLDELPEHARRAAVARINRTLDGDRPVVLTCRTVEYHDHIDGGAPALLRAAVVRVRAVDVADILAYLREVPDWQGLASHVERRPAGAVAQTLSTPLMLSLFAAAYKGRRPEDLLQNKSLTTRHEVEDYLVDTLLERAYPAEKSRFLDWTAGQAKRWLTFVAQHLHQQKVRELSPWQMTRSLLEPAFVPVVALVPLVAYLRFGSAEAFLVVAMLGSMFGAMGLASGRRVPGRKAFDDKRQAETFGRGMATGVAAVLMLGIPFFLLDFLDSDQDHGAIVALSASVSAMVAMAVAVGLGLGLNEVLVARMFARFDARNSSRDYLVRDRVSALIASVSTALFVGLMAVPFATVLSAFGGYFGQRVAVWVGVPAVVEFRLPLKHSVPWEVSWAGSDGMVVTSLWLAVVFGFAVLGTRTWTWLLVLRAVLAVSRRLPWRLLRFLEDGRQRGVLRGSGGYYQFGHVVLYERIIATAVVEKPRAGRRWARPVVAAVAGVVLVAGMVSVGWSAPADCGAVEWEGGVDWPELDQRIAREVADEQSGCFALVHEDEWDKLAQAHGTQEELAEVQAAQPPGGFGYQRLVIAGEFDRVDEARWVHLLEGIQAAQRVSDRRLQIVFVYADVGGVRGPDAALLTSEFVSSVFGRTTALNIDLSHSLLRTSDTDVVGWDDGNLDALLARMADNTADIWLSEGRIQLADGVSAEECASLGGIGRNSNFDIRGAAEPLDLLDDIARCGAANVLVDGAAVRQISAEGRRFPALKIVRLESVAETIRPACQRHLPAGHHAEAMTTCVAASTATRLSGNVLVDVHGAADG